MKFVLHLKHWQLFLITFAVPFVLYFVMMITIMLTAFSNGRMEGFPEVPVVLMVLVALAWLASGVTTISWVFNVATGLHKKLTPDVPLKMNRFYFAFFFPFAYFAFIIIFVGTIVMSNFPIMTPGGPPEVPAFFGYFVFIMPVHLFAMACMFYILFFLAKSLKSVELKKEALVNDYMAEFVLMWFSFVGVWFIQPRINKIFSEESSTHTSGQPDRI